MAVGGSPAPTGDIMGVVGMVSGMVPAGSVRIQLVGDPSVGCSVAGMDRFPPEVFDAPWGVAADLVERGKAVYVPGREASAPEVIETRDPVPETRDPVVRRGKRKR